MFDEEIDRKNTNSLKYDALEQRFRRDDLIPLWVADMDFATPMLIQKEIQKRAKHSIYGYSQIDNDFFNSIINK